MAQPPFSIFNNTQTPMPTPRRRGFSLFDADSPWPNRIGLFGAGLQDASAFLDGHPEAAGYIKEYQARNAAQEAQRSFMEALQSGDPARINQAAMAYEMAGGDSGRLKNAQHFSDPTLSWHSENDSAFDSQGNVVRQGVPRAPTQSSTITGDTLKNWEWRTDPLTGKAGWVERGSGRRFEGKTPPKTTRVPGPWELYK